MPQAHFDLKIEKKIKPFNSVINVDSDKSISIRSFLIGSICEGISIVKNVLESEDVFSTIKCLKKLGIKIKKLSNKNYAIYGKGLGSLASEKNITLDFGNSGTLARLLVGVLTTTPNIKLRLTGDKSLNKRSMKKLINLMEIFGATFFPKNKIRLPLRLSSSKIPIGIRYKAGISAQLKSAVMLAGLNSFGTTEIEEDTRSRDHTENLLLENSKAIKVFKNKKKIIKIFGKNSLKPFKISVPGDPSSAAFFTALALLNKRSSLLIKSVGLNETRIGFYKILKKQNAKIQFKNIKKKNNEPRGDIFIKSCKIKPINAGKSFYVNSTDEYPILFVIAALSKGVSVFKGIEDLANKESNRIVEMQKILRQINIKSKFYKNSLKIFGKGMINAERKKIFVPNLGDHRICMSSVVLAALTGARLKIKNFETVNTSSPSFLKIAKSIGINFEVQK